MLIRLRNTHLRFFYFLFLQNLFKGSFRWNYFRLVENALEFCYYRTHNREMIRNFVICINEWVKFFGHFQRYLHYYLKQYMKIQQAKNKITLLTNMNITFLQLFLLTIIFMHVLWWCKQKSFNLCLIEFSKSRNYVA